MLKPFKKIKAKLLVYSFCLVLFLSLNFIILGCGQSKNSETEQGQADQTSYSQEGEEDTVVIPVDSYFSMAVTENSHNHAGARLLFLDFQDSPPDTSVIQNNVVISVKINSGAIILDGNSSDWNPDNLTTVNGLVQNNYPLSRFIDAMPTDITIGSAWDENYIYFLVQWEDAGHTQSSKYEKWIYGDQGNNETGWNPKVHTGVTQGAPNENAANATHYLAGTESEDRVLMMFPIVDSENNFRNGALGCAAYCHANLRDDNPFQNYTGMNVVAMHTNTFGDNVDIWHWKSTRTAPSGYADDEKMIYAAGSDNGIISDSGSAAYSNNGLVSGNPEYLYNSGLSYTDDTLFIGDTVSFYGTPSLGDQVPSVIVKQPTGSRADVEAGAYYDSASGRWTVEFRRLLSTENNDDHQFLTGTDSGPPSYPAISVIDSGRGEILYSNYCKSCHGANGSGSTAGNSWAFPRIQRTSGSLIFKALKTVVPMQAISLTDQDVEDIAAFLQTQATFNDTNILSVTVDGADVEVGVISSSPTGIDCPNRCSYNFVTGTTVTLQADYVDGYTFTGWSGGGCSGSGSCTVTMAEDQSVTATYTAATTYYTLTVTNSGNGSVISSSGGIDCGSDCIDNFSDGTSITLTATPSVGYEFDGWGGTVCSGTGQCVFTVNSDTIITASFSPVVNADCENGGITFDAGGTNGFGLQQVINVGLVSNPTDLAFVPGVENGFLVLAQSGLVYYFNGGCDPVNFVDLRSTGSGGIGVVNGGEQGLLNLEFHPDFSNNKYVFFYHTSVSSNTNSVSRMTLSFTLNGELVLSDPVKIIDFRKPSNAGNHNGGGLVFAPDNTLLASVGDGGSGNSANAQINTNLLGAVIRIIPELAQGMGGYGIPTGNMFDSGNPQCSNIAQSDSPCPEILAMGLRNPYRMSIYGNIVYLGDVGSTYEEIDSFDYTDNNVNFGWPTYDGSAGGETGYRDPLLEYRRDDSTADSFRSEDPMGESTGYASVMIGDVYNGSLYGGLLTGRLLHAEFMDGYMRALAVDDSGNRTDMGIHLIHHDGISAMIVGPDDYVYVITQGGAWGTTGPDMVYRLVKP